MSFLLISFIIVAVLHFYYVCRHLLQHACGALQTCCRSLHRTLKKELEELPEEEPESIFRTDKSFEGRLLCIRAEFLLQYLHCARWVMALYCGTMIVRSLGGWAEDDEISNHTGQSILVAILYSTAASLHLYPQWITTKSLGFIHSCCMVAILCAAYQWSPQSAQSHGLVARLGLAIAYPELVPNLIWSIVCAVIDMWTDKADLEHGASRAEQEGKQIDPPPLEAFGHYGSLELANFLFLTFVVRSIEVFQVAKVRAEMTYDGLRSSETSTSNPVQNGAEKHCANGIAPRDGEHARDAQDSGPSKSVPNSGASEKAHNGIPPKTVQTNVPSSTGLTRAVAKTRQMASGKARPK